MERQAREFELLKPYLVDRWRAAATAARAARPADREGPRDERRAPARPRILIPVANPLTAEELIRIGRRSWRSGPAS